MLRYKPESQNLKLSQKVKKKSGWKKFFLKHESLSDDQRTRAILEHF
jgi:hypothetical protein